MLLLMVILRISVCLGWHKNRTIFHENQFTCPKLKSGIHREHGDMKQLLIPYDRNVDWKEILSGVISLHDIHKGTTVKSVQ